MNEKFKRVFGGKIVNKRLTTRTAFNYPQVVDSIQSRCGYQ